MATLIALETVAASTRAFPAQTGRPWGRPRGARHHIGHHELTGQFRIDLRDQAPDLFEDVSAMDWSTLTWRDVGRPYRTEKWSSARRTYEQEHQQPLPIIDGWHLFNTAFHQFFLTDVPEAQRQAKAQFGEALSRLDMHEAKDALQDIAYLAVWNKIMRVEDAVWDPRGKRALFAGLDVKKPRILFLGVDPTTGHQRVWYRDEMPIHFEVADIRDLQYGREFDVVVSIGLLEHFPDAHKDESRLPRIDGCAADGVVLPRERL